MHDLFICFKSIALISLIWLMDFLMINLSSLSIMPLNVREFFLESKEVINWIVSVSVLYATYLKIRNEKRK